MSGLKFKGKIWEVGNSFVITVPRDFLNNEILTKGKVYWFQIIEEVLIKAEAKAEIIPEIDVTGVNKLKEGVF